MSTPTALLIQLLSRRGGSLGRRLAPGVDLFASLGLRELLRRSREEARHTDQWPGQAVYQEIWEGAARACDVPVVALGTGFVEFDTGTPPARVWMHMTPLDNAVALRFALDKAATHAVLEANELPVPEHYSFDFADPRPAKRLVEAGGAWVLKPARDTSSGQGTTVGLRTVDEFLRASARVARSSNRQLLERRVPGEEYRLLLLDGEVLGVVRRSPPVVIGDGVHTVTELVHAENRRRLASLGHAGIALITLDLDATLTLERAGTSPRSVPPPEMTLQVKTACSQAGSRETETVPTDAVGGELVEEARRAVRALGLRLAGIDLITSDLSQSLSATGGAIIEVNGTPGLHYHYLVNGPANPVAVPVLAKVLEAHAADWSPHSTAKLRGSSTGSED